MNTTTTADLDRTVFRAVHRDTLEVLAFGVPGILSECLAELEVDPAEVDLYTSAGGRHEDPAGRGAAAVLADARTPVCSLHGQAGRDAEQDRLNGLRSDDANGLRVELARASEADHPTLARYGHHRDRWFLGRMEEDHEADGHRIRKGDLVLYVPTPERPAFPISVYAIRAGADQALPAAAAGALVRVAEGWLEIELIGVPGSDASARVGEPGAVVASPAEGAGANVKVDGVVIGCAMRLGPVSFVASAYPTTLGAEYTVGPADTLDAAIGAVYREWEAGWERSR
jgi:hypothetical protein